MRISTAIAAFFVLLALGAGIFTANAQTETPPKAAATKATTADLEAAARKAAAAFKAKDFSALGDLMPSWIKERTTLEQARAKAKLESIPNVEQQLARNFMGKDSLDPMSTLKIADKATFLALTPAQFFALDSGFLKLIGSAAAEKAIGGDWFLVNVEDGLMASLRPSAIVQTTQHVTMATFENAARDFACFAFCDVDGRWMLCGWEVSVGGTRIDSQHAGRAAGAISIYDDSLDRLDEPVAKAKVTHILVKVGDTAKPEGGKRTEDEAKALCEELWKKYRDTPEEDREKVWKEMQLKYNEDGAPHNVYEVQPNSQFIPLFKDVALTTEVGGVRIAPFDKQRSPYGYHLIRREK
ncbi:MAG: hypothetical protein IT462_16975 [Planctomycetes bacterium]|nr:hypothetical protein [Planctomycetota bacterium]